MNYSVRCIDIYFTNHTAVRDNLLFGNIKTVAFYVWKFVFISTFRYYFFYNVIKILRPIFDYSLRDYSQSWTHCSQIGNSAIGVYYFYGVIELE